MSHPPEAPQALLLLAWIDLQRGDRPSAEARVLALDAIQVDALHVTHLAPVLVG